jgi:hypothetical protein
MKKTFSLLAILIVLISCNHNPDKNNLEIKTPVISKNKSIRYGLVRCIKPDKLNYYKNLHAHP